MEAEIFKTMQCLLDIIASREGKTADELVVEGVRSQQQRYVRERELYQSASLADWQKVLRARAQQQIQKEIGAEVRIK